MITWLFEKKQGFYAMTNPGFQLGVSDKRLGIEGTMDNTYLYKP